jgi:TIR domain
MKRVPQIFLSYTRSDSNEVESLYRRLQQEGFRPWMDIRDILPGEIWKSRIKKEIRRSDFFFACLSKKAIGKRGMLQTEIKLAMEIWEEMLSEDIYLIPIRLEECDVPDSLQDFQRVDLFTDDGWSLLLKSVHTGLTSRHGLGSPFPTESVERHASLPLEPASFHKPVVAEPERADKLAVVDALTEISPGWSTESLSVSAWERHLLELLREESSDVMAQAGDIRRDVELSLEKSENRVIARAAFHEALRKVVEHWAPEFMMPHSNLTRIFDLISAYTPPAGFAKVLHFLRYSLHSRRPATTSPAAVVPPGLILKTLVVLESYFPVAPPPPENSTPAFNAYVGVLRECLLYQEYCGYVAGRLVALNVIELNGREVTRLIRSCPDSLQQILELVLSPRRRLKVVEDLAQIYAHCLSAGYDMALAFADALKSHGVYLRHGEDGPVIYLSAQEAVPLHLPSENLAAYMAVRWEIDDERDKHSRPSGGERLA